MSRIDEIKQGMETWKSGFKITNQEVTSFVAYVEYLLAKVERYESALRFYAEQNVYRAPEDYSYRKMGGPPDFEDYEEVSYVAKDALEEEK